MILSESHILCQSFGKFKIFIYSNKTVCTGKQRGYSFSLLLMPAAALPIAPFICKHCL